MRKTIILRWGMNKSLVVIDLQNDITKNYRDIIGNVNKAIEIAKNSG